MRNSVRIIKPKVFIGSSSESLGVARQVKQKLGSAYDVQIWTEEFFVASSITLPNLLEKAQEFDLAVFIFAPDDKINIRGKRFWISRDNVILEYGLFLSKLGQGQCFVLAPSGNDCRTPNDMDGFTSVKYKWRHVSTKHGCVIRLKNKDCLQKLKSAINKKKGPLFGKWIQNWKVKGSKHYNSNNQSPVMVIHFGSRFRGVFRLEDEHTYEAIGEQVGNIVTGYWRDRNDFTNYSGTFQLRVQGASVGLSGRWMGFSTEKGIRSDKWTWKRVSLAKRK